MCVGGGVGVGAVVVWLSGFVILLLLFLPLLLFFSLLLLFALPFLFLLFFLFLFLLLFLFLFPFLPSFYSSFFHRGNKR